jgi:uncharacterized membrane protein
MIKETTLHKIIFGLLIFQVLFAAFLAYDEYSNSGFCSVGSCDTVQNSGYGELFGISFNYLAIVCFIALFLAYKHNNGIYIVGVTIGGLFSLYLIFLQLFVIQEICSNCMVIDSVMIIIAILTFRSKTYRKHLNKVFSN